MTQLYTCPPTALSVDVTNESPVQWNLMPGTQSASVFDVDQHLLPESDYWTSEVTSKQLDVTNPNVETAAASGFEPTTDHQINRTSYLLRSAWAAAAPCLKVSPTQPTPPGTEKIYDLGDPRPIDVVIGGGKKSLLEPAEISPQPLNAMVCIVYSVTMFYWL